MFAKRKSYCLKSYIAKNFTSNGIIFGTFYDSDLEFVVWQIKEKSLGKRIFLLTKGLFRSKRIL